MTTQGFALFDTAIGRCGLAWSQSGLIGVQLPEATPGAAWARLRKRFPDAVEADPPPEVEAAIDRIRDLLAGDRDDLADIVLDQDGQSAFNLRVYAIARAIPPGETSTYGQVARALGEPGAARAVGKALGENPWPIVVPCHRVLGSSGTLGGFSGSGGGETKARLLTIEKARTSAAPTLFDLEFSVAPPRGG
ncbi:methylated-DNA--[protein]-cysteine S-methyltransferase [Caulobacter vibrioides]|uniref:methylated-DNA--[protein]-cysteine S-methyltransferase n=2 Tax=Caulobacter vibrioides TaxID=155892 RepID=Q9AAE3_CAUVC|nr:methylated-DNA--[protein]-cysteine S-methyltransferase [Caulobacter vibrioides]YP_002516069.1 O6-methylguanine-DNA methyltransferase [Caulobacter vibrioides NA1000]AAK22644.1 methylated-DNA--protein-cysteine methyltransferase [Caulobacter vibrioides CB15]ACL94161.1 O6-methylguanine-DNA methyltransferase [Caulobacter vibrioides NA1000]ATC27504.1 methylated-DNA--[protein]-cysteine S-methyltransferase [Caulobacter vibrioides]QXZ52739.1 methylated-DNA--[protein]-cysteine S-methyltransferase [Ca